MRQVIGTIFPVYCAKKALGVRGWLTLRPDRFNPAKKFRYQLNRRLNVSKILSGRFEVQKNLLPQSGFEPRNVKPIS
jgi:hypothetical protein